MSNGRYPKSREQANQTEPTPSPSAILSGLQQKRQIVRELIDGQLPLLEAAAKFQAVRRTSDSSFERLTGVVTGTDPESICRTVIGWVHLVLSDRPEQAERVSQKLESELQGHLQGSGSANLLLRC